VLEVIVAAPAESVNEISKLLSYHSFKFRCVTCATNGLNKLVMQSLRNANGQIVAWLNAGTIINSDCLRTVAMIFKSNQSINWLRGVDENANDRVRTFQYRLVPGEAYKRLRTDSLDVSTELHFFYKKCIEKILDEELHLNALFLELLLNYELRIAVHCFGIKAKHLEVLMETSANEEFGKRLRPYQIKTGFSSKFINLIMRTPFFNDGSWQWYYTALHNFPDVLRYDAINNNFYNCKF
jgi:hypothetical protein